MVLLGRINVLAVARDTAYFRCTQEGRSFMESGEGTNAERRIPSALSPVLNREKMFHSRSGANLLPESG